jgi:hypothetical protein
VGRGGDDGLNGSKDRGRAQEKAESLRGGSRSALVAILCEPADCCVVDGALIVVFGDDHCRTSWSSTTATAGRAVVRRHAGRAE